MRASSTSPPSRTWRRGGSSASACPSITTPRSPSPRLKMAAAVRGGDVTGVIFHSDRGSEYTADLFEQACSRSGITQSMGRVGSCFDNAAAESWSTRRSSASCSATRHFATKDDARREVAGYIDCYNRTRRHSSCEMKSPIEFEAILAARAAETVTEEEAA